jgi:hypothetical protein
MLELDSGTVDALALDLAPKIFSFQVASAQDRRPNHQ